MDNKNEKYLSESLLSEEPKKKYVLKLKNNSVTGDKIAPNAVDWDKLSQRIKDLFAAIQAAIGEPIDPETIKEMIKNVINDMIDSGEEIVDIDTVAEKVAEIIQVENKNFIPFDGVMPKGTSIDVLDVQAPQDVEGNVLFYPQTGTFIYRVYEEPEEPIPGQITPPVSKYYKYWEEWTDYKDAQDTPKSKVVFVLRNGSAYYYWDGSELQEFVTETSLASTIDDLDIESAAVTGENGVKVVETTKVVDDKTVKIKTASLADIPKDANNMIGTTYNFNSILPIESKNKGNTKHIITTNITGQITGYEDGQPKIDTSKITLPSGSKIVPNGGIPAIRVEGGETSWVHSSDIGMIQYTGEYDATIGSNNFSILKRAVNANYNIIFDGAYYINGVSKTTDCIQVNKSLGLKDGRLIFKGKLFMINVGASFVCENLTIERKAQYTVETPIHITPNRKLENGVQVFDENDNPVVGVVERVEFINCNFIAPDKKTKFISVADAYVRPSDIVAKYYWSIDSLNQFGYSTNRKVAIDFSTNYIYVVPNTYTVEETKDSEGTITGYTIKRNSTIVTDWDAIALEKHDLSDTLKLETQNQPDSQTYIFVVSDDDSIITDITTVDNTTSTGYYVLYSDATEEEKSTTNGKFYVEVDDNSSMPTADQYGVRTFRMIDCTCEKATVSIGNVQYIEACDFINTRFTNFTSTAIDIGIDNNNHYATIWGRRSCRYRIENCYFDGGKVDSTPGQGNYTCAVKTEGASVSVKNCTLQNIVGMYYASYDCYLSNTEVIFENNYVYNVFGLFGPTYVYERDEDGNIVHDADGKAKRVSIIDPYYTPERGWFKAKGGGVLNGRNRTRIFRNNTYKIDYAVAKAFCYDILTEEYTNNPLYTGDKTVDQLFDELGSRVWMLNSIHNDAADILIEGNTFDAPGFILCGQGAHGSKLPSPTLTIKNNLYHFKTSESSPDKPLFTVIPSTAGDTAEVTIEKNTFMFEVPTRLGLLDVDSNLILTNLSIMNNTFSNCDYGMNLLYPSSYRGLIKAERAVIDNNYDIKGTVPYTKLESAVVDGASGMSRRGDLFRLAISDSFNIAIDDIQTDDGVVPDSRFIEIPRASGKLVLRSKFIKRSIVLNDGAYSSGNTLMLRLSGGNFLPLGDAGCVPTTRDYYKNGWNYGKATYRMYGAKLGNCTYAFDITYTYKGERKTKHTEFIHTMSRVYPTNTFRDVYGICHQVQSSTIWRLEVPGIDEINLGMFLEGLDMTYNVENIEDLTSDVSGHMLMHIYSTETDGENKGTCNDKGTDIIISVYRIEDTGLFPAKNYGTNDATNMTPISAFVAPNSAVSQSWLDAMSAGWESKAGLVSYMRPADTGMRVHVDKQWYTWNGTAWVPDRAIVSLTQAAYDAIATKDENTLYLIVDSQS